MAHMKNNIQALCFVVLLMMSSTLWSCEATARNQGVQLDCGLHVRLSEHARHQRP
uniref:Uncharacterized protein n=1 Tax=Aegilops tauschii subsp. strangulata TaxID=200361 RepID=A0A453DUC8_AEGTS